MKNIKKITCLLVLLLTVFTSCNNDFSYTGTLEIRTQNSLKNIHVYTLEDTTNPIYSITFNGEKSYSIDINAGNYKITGYTNNGYLSTVTLQIRPDQTTTVEYDSNNERKEITN